MKDLRITSLYDLNETIAPDFMKTAKYPWQLFSHINGAIRELGETLSPDFFDRTGSDIWIAKTATVAPTAVIEGPCIIDASTEIRHATYISGALIGKFAIVENSTVKNSILFNWVQLLFNNYVCDSIIGSKTRIGAGAMISNNKADGTLVNIKAGKVIESALKTIGAMVGDNVEIGCNTVLNPGTVIGRNSVIYPLSMVRGFVPENSVYKKQGEIVDRISAY